MREGRGYARRKPVDGPCHGRFAPFVARQAAPPLVFGGDGTSSQRAWGSPSRRARSISHSTPLPARSTTVSVGPLDRAEDSPDREVDVQPPTEGDEQICRVPRRTRLNEDRLDRRQRLGSSSSARGSPSTAVARASVASARSVPSPAYAGAVSPPSVHVTVGTPTDSDRTPAIKPR